MGSQVRTAGSGVASRSWGGTEGALRALRLLPAAKRAAIAGPGPRRSAPELLMGQRCTEKADVYSMGVVL